MQALVLAVCPAPVAGYAVVHGTRIYEAGSWALASEVRTQGRHSTPQDVVSRIMERRLSDELEHLASTYDRLDAFVIEIDAGPRLHAAAERGALLARCDYRLIEPGAWSTAREDADVDPGTKTGLSTPGRSDGIAEASKERAILLGLHASTRMGIWPLDALPDGSEWA